MRNIIKKRRKKILKIKPVYSVKFIYSVCIKKFNKKKFLTKWFKILKFYVKNKVFMIKIYVFKMLLMISVNIEIKISLLMMLEPLVKDYFYADQKIVIKIKKHRKIIYRQMIRWETKLRNVKKMKKLSSNIWENLNELNFNQVYIILIFYQPYLVKLIQILHMLFIILLLLHFLPLDLSNFNLLLLIQLKLIDLYKQ